MRRFSELQVLTHAFRDAQKLLGHEQRGYGDPDKQKLSLMEHAAGAALMLAYLRRPIEEIIAALYHDVFEECRMMPSEKIRTRLLNKYGPRVLDLVDVMTEDRTFDSWQARKDDALVKLRDADESAAHVNCAVKTVHLDYADRHRRAGHDIFRWSKGDLENNIWFHQQLLEIYQIKGVHHDLVIEFSRRRQTFIMWKAGSRDDLPHSIGPGHTSAWVGAPTLS